MAGDLGAPTAVTADSTWVVRRVVGKRLQEPSKALGHAAKRRLRPGHLPAICAEVYVGSASAIFEACGRRLPAPPHRPTGRARRPLLRWPQGLAYGQRKNHDKGRGIAWDEVRALYGKARLQPVLTLLGSKQINPRAVERHKGTSRLRHQRKGR